MQNPSTNVEQRDFFVENNFCKSVDITLKATFILDLSRQEAYT